LKVLKQYQGRPRRQARQSPQIARQLRITQEREGIVDAALAVVKVGVADAACLDVHDRLARTGVRDDDGLDRHRHALRPGDDTSHLLRHARTPSMSQALADHFT
jgi:hypothetical protein